MGRDAMFAKLSVANGRGPNVSIGDGPILPGEPLVGAAAVRELTGSEDDRKARRDAMFAKLTAQNGHGPNRSLVEGGAIHSGAMADEWTKDAHGVIGAGLTADVENDGDRGLRRDPLSVLDQAADAARAKAVQRLMAAVAGLSVDEVAALAWVAWQLPGRKLRRKCEEATATGWCGSDLAANAPAGRSTPEDRTRAALLAAWRQVVALVHGARSSASEDLRQRSREDVLADEAARRAGGGK